MSVRVLSKVWDGYPGGGTELLALLALADWSDDEGRCFPSIKSIAKKIRLKERQAQRAVNKLINNGYVKVISNKFGGSPGSTRNYQIIINNLTGVIYDTPSDETGVIQDANGCHITPLTGVTDDTLTVIEPSLTVSAKFSKFWNAYPKKKSKGDAEKAFKSINPDSETLEQILAAIEIQKRTSEWSKDNGRYIKYPATWLRGKAWLDEFLVTNTNDLMDGVL